MEIIAHRGASWDAPENTLGALALGFQHGADAVELDAHLSGDGKIAVLHDADTERVGGVSMRVAQHTLRDLRGLDVGAWGHWSARGFSEPIPELREVLAIVPDDRKVFIEIKCGTEILPELRRAIDHSMLSRGQIVLIGFGYETMRMAKAVLSDLQALWLAGRDKDTKEYPPLERLIERAKDAGLDGLDLEKGFPIDREFVRRVHDAGLKLYTWTVDDPELAKTERAAGVDGITTNRPGWLRKQLR